MIIHVDHTGAKDPDAFSDGAQVSQLDGGALQVTTERESVIYAPGVWLRVSALRDGGER